MNIKRTVAFALIGAVAVSGCVSIESTRARLNSKDAAEVKKGEDTIYQVATAGQDSTGFVKFTTKEQVEYVRLTSNQELLLRIIDKSNNGDVIEAAIERIDFSKSGAAKEFVLNRFGKIDCIRRYEWKNGGRREDVSHEVQNRLKMQIVFKLTQDELLALIEDKKTDYHVRDMLIDRLIEITDSPAFLWRILNGDIHTIGKEYSAEQRLLSMLDKVTDEVIIHKMLAYRSSAGFLIKDADKRILLMSKLPESKMVELALKDINGHSVYAWNNNDFMALEQGIGITAYIKDSNSVVKLVAAVLAKIAAYRKECKNNWSMSWGNSDEAQVKKLIEGIPQLSDTTIAALVCLNESTWKYLIDKVTPDNAYIILTQGKAKYDDLEVALIKKLPQRKVDMKVFAGVKTNAGGKAVLAAMPDELKETALAAIEKAFDSVLEKAKAAAKETFELHGFYLGMSLDDAKILVAHHFPDVEITEGKDDDGEYKLDVSGQDIPFCWSDKERKVYQFNFGKQLLKKWFKYNAARTMDWAKAFSREHNIEMKLDFLERSDDVYLPNAMLQMEPHHVSLHQETWTYKDGMKNYRVTYFGERKFGGNGPMIKSAAHDKYMYISAPEGTLRAKVDND